jgi:hypothetical protein
VVKIAGVSVINSPSRDRIGTRPLGLRCRCCVGKPRAAPRLVVVKGREDSRRAMWEARETEPGVI